MLRILHAADLHLSESDKEYGLSVLAELVETARRERADLLLFCGDLFNTFTDAGALRVEFRRLLGTLPCEFLYLPGNHEDLQRGSGELKRLDLGPVTLLDSLPFGLTRREYRRVPVEILSVPHQVHYAGYGNWPIPPKQSPWRIALAHGVVAGMAYRGPDEEGGGTAIDPDLFLRYGADYAALGHIHGRRTQTFGASVLAYPGSARVWRRHENGPRGALLMELPDSPGSAALSEPAFLPLNAAGEYRQYAMPLSLDGEPPDVDALAKGWGRADFIELKFSGLVEDERQVAQIADRIRARYASRVRCLEIDRDGVSALPGIASQPIVRRFLEAWAGRMPRPDPSGSPDSDAAHAAEHAVWIRAREVALNVLKAGLERTL